MSQLSLRTPEVIAVEIGSIKEQTRNFVLESSISIGRKLIEAKELVAHGEWIDWLKNSVEYSQSTANNLMQLHREYGSSNSQVLGNLSYTKALYLIAVSEEEREGFVEKNDVDNMSARDLQQAIKEKQALEKQLKKSEAETEKVRKAKEALEAKNKKHDELVQQLNDKIKEAEEKANNKDQAIIPDDNKEVLRLQEAIRISEKERIDSQAKVKQLEQQLKEKPIDVPAVVEKVPEAVQKELDELRKQVTLLNQQSDKAVVRFQFNFESIVKGFQTVLSDLEVVENAEVKEKCRNAIKGLIGKMSESL